MRTLGANCNDEDPFGTPEQRKAIRHGAPRLPAILPRNYDALGGQKIFHRWDDKHRASCHQHESAGINDHFSRHGTARGPLAYDNQIGRPGVSGYKVCNEVALETERGMPFQGFAHPCRMLEAVRGMHQILSRLTLLQLGSLGFGSGWVYSK